MQVQSSKLTAFTVDIQPFLDLLIDNEEEEKTADDKPANFKTMREGLYDLALDQLAAVKALGIAKEFKAPPCPFTIQGAALKMVLAPLASLYMRAFEFRAFSRTCICSLETNFLGCEFCVRCVFSGSSFTSYHQARHHKQNDQMISSSTSL